MFVSIINNYGNYTLTIQDKEEEDMFGFHFFLISKNILYQCLYQIDTTKNSISLSSIECVTIFNHHVSFINESLI